MVARVQRGESLTMEEMSETIGRIMEGVCSEEDIAALLIGLHEKGETVAEIAGAAAAMRLRMTTIQSTRLDLIDVVGTGGDSSGTFNISTAAALVTAAAGQPVAKHGNRRFTSRSGSADVLAELGVNIEAGVELVEACLEELGICFCFAPLLHQAMRHVGPVRKRISTPTIFNILGPLANPARTPYQLLGVGKPGLRPLLSEALAMLGSRRVLVV
ncbi:MAG: anthranilate phosphoribosyltransferase, partial [Thermoguttaceae bacterium]